MIPEKLWSSSELRVVPLFFIFLSSLFPESTHPSRPISGPYNVLSKKTPASQACPELVLLCSLIPYRPIGQIVFCSSCLALCLLNWCLGSCLQPSAMVTDPWSDSLSVDPKMNEYLLRPTFDSPPLPAISGGCVGCQQDDGAWSFVTSEVTGPRNFLTKTQCPSDLWVYSFNMRRPYRLYSQGFTIAIRTLYGHANYFMLFRNSGLLLYKFFESPKLRNTLIIFLVSKLYIHMIIYIWFIYINLPQWKPPWKIMKLLYYYYSLWHNLLLDLRFF